MSETVTAWSRLTRLWQTSWNVSLFIIKYITSATSATLSLHTATMSVFCERLIAVTPSSACFLHQLQALEGTRLRYSLDWLPSHAAWLPGVDPGGPFRMSAYSCIHNNNNTLIGTKYLRYPSPWWPRQIADIFGYRQQQYINRQKISQFLCPSVGSVRMPWCQHQ